MSDRLEEVEQFHYNTDPTSFPASIKLRPNQSSEFLSRRSIRFSSSYLFYIYTPLIIPSQLIKKISALYDNQSYVNKLIWFFKDEYHHHDQHKQIEVKALAIILKFIPRNVSFYHVRGHLYNSNSNYHELEVKTQLNINVDTIERNQHLP